MEITVKVDDKLVQEVKDARSSLAKLKAAIDKARKAAAKWFDPDGLKLSEESEKKISDAHLAYDSKVAEMTNCIAETILGQKIDVDSENGINNGPENGQQVKNDGANADTEPNTLRKLAKQQEAEQVKNIFADGTYVTINDVNIMDLNAALYCEDPAARKSGVEKNFKDLSVGLKRVALYLDHACITKDKDPIGAPGVYAFMEAIKAIDELPENDWKLLFRAFIVTAENTYATDWSALLLKLSDTAKLDNVKDLFRSICARMYAVIGEPKKDIYNRVCEAIENAKKWNLPEELDDEEPKETAPETTKEEKKEAAKEPAADAKFPAPVEELPEFLARVKKANTKEDINKLSGEARVATTGSEAKGLVFYGDPFITTKDYSLLQQAIADREQEIKKKEVKDFRFLRRAGDFKSSFAVRIAHDLYRRIKGDKDIKFDYLRDITGLLTDDKEKAQLLAEINTTARNVGELKE